jgi:hypothetical protein
MKMNQKKFTLKPQSSFFRPLLSFTLLSRSTPLSVWHRANGLIKNKTMLVISSLLSLFSPLLLMLADESKKKDSKTNEKLEQAEQEGKKSHPPIK